VWEIAGLSHVDQWIGACGEAEHNWDDTGLPQQFDAASAGDWGQEGGQSGVCMLFTGPDPVRADEMPQQYTHDAAFAAMQLWVTRGRAPAVTPPLAFDRNGAAARDGSGGGVATDRFGNPRGGLRLLQVS
jgi:hypothetical protein